MDRRLFDKIRIGDIEEVEYRECNKQIYCLGGDVLNSRRRKYFVCIIESNSSSIRNQITEVLSSII